MTEKSLSDSRQNSSEDQKSLVLLTLFFNSADAFFTYLAIAQGCTELNPVMAFVLKGGMVWFLFTKLIVTNSMILFVGIVGTNYKVGKIGVVLVTWLYGLLSLYHLVNLAPLFMRGK